MLIQLNRLELPTTKQLKKSIRKAEDVSSNLTFVTIIIGGLSVRATLSAPTVANSNKVDSYSNYLETCDVGLQMF